MDRKTKTAAVLLNGLGIVAAVKGETPLFDARNVDGTCTQTTLCIGNVQKRCCGPDVHNDAYIIVNLGTSKLSLVAFSYIN